MRLPKGFTAAQSYVDWIGNTVVPEDTVLIGQRDGDRSRMWIGEVVAIAERQYTEQRWTGRRDAQGKGIFETVDKVEHSVLVQPVSGSLYSPGASRHSWKLKLDWNGIVERDERGNALYDESDKPRSSWTKAEFVVKYPKEFLP